MPRPGKGGAPARSPGRTLAVLAAALGALLGGLPADAYSLTAVLLAGAALTLAACPVAALSGRNTQS
ncbi:hypothetical protein OG814_20560 [Streptomyces zaomyceticus]|uniref:DUF2892 domain-containing protein n=1 Tax=Streptomyces zaomyceticus TaxID=68286 RepID=A0ABZ1LAM1_9ACTN